MDALKALVAKNRFVRDGYRVNVQSRDPSGLRADEDVSG